MSNRFRDVAQSVPVILYVCLLGFFFAKVEIMIEGSDGWASSLPTWRIESHPLLDIFWGGRPLTGYHAWVFAFMFLIFHLPLVFARKFSWRLEMRVLGLLMLFWIVEDALWFILNPAYGIRQLTPEVVPWHKHWLFGLPADYITFTVTGLILIFFSHYQGDLNRETENGGST